MIEGVYYNAHMGKSTKLLSSSSLFPQTTTTFVCNFSCSSLLTMSSSVMGSQGVVVATAMALSGTVILIALRLQKSLPPLSPSASPILRSCISSSERKKGQKKKKKVHFAEDVVDSRSDGEEFRRKHRLGNSSVYSNSEMKMREDCNGRTEIRGMPANRVALYNGILRDRGSQRRLAYSY